VAYQFEAIFSIKPRIARRSAAKFCRSAGWAFTSRLRYLALSSAPAAVLPKTPHRGAATHIVACFDGNFIAFDAWRLGCLDLQLYCCSTLRIGEIMRLLIALVVAALPTAAIGKPVYLKCDFAGAESARITLNEEIGKASIEQGTVTRTVDAIYTADTVRILKLQNAMGGQTIRINRVDLSSIFVVTVGRNDVTMDGSCRLQAPPKRAF
jgi:hypothetical protein